MARCVILAQALLRRVTENTVLSGELVWAGEWHALLGMHVLTTRTKSKISGTI